jgi:DNA integrity scanning protein DisA with diadenylate cyclase activity
MVKKIQDIEEKVIKISLEIAKDGEGCLFLIGEKVSYDNLIKKKSIKLNIFEKGAEKILKGLSVIDGAVILDNKGNLIAYGAMVKKAKPFLGFGTRHAAAMTGSKNGNIAILASEEERKVKIFKDGKYIMQLDALQKGVVKNASTASKILESTGAGFLGTLGTVTLAPTVGIALIPGIIIFGGSYYAIKSILEKNGK